MHQPAKRAVMFSFLFLSAINTIPALLGNFSPTEISYYFSSFYASFRLVDWGYTVSNWESSTQIAKTIAITIF